MMTRIHRRAAFLAATGALAAPAILPALGRAEAAESTMDIPALAPYRRFRLGAFDVTALLAGSGAIENPQSIFGMNVPAEEFSKVSAAAFIPADSGRSFMVPTLVETGSETVLFDTGIRPEGIVAALKAAGKSVEDIGLVVITHMHGDHIGGLMTNGTPTFPKARYVTGKAEWDYWSGAGAAAFDANVRPLQDRFAFLGDGDAPFAGAKAILAPGHTPGHMVFALESGGQQMMLTADLANHYVWSLGHPDWEVRYDMDKAKAAQSRRKILSELAEKRIPFIGYHMPFPAAGFVETAGEGFRFVAVTYQLG